MEKTQLQKQLANDTELILNSQTSFALIMICNSTGPHGHSSMGNFSHTHTKKKKKREREREERKKRRKTKRKKEALMHMYYMINY